MITVQAYSIAYFITQHVLKQDFMRFYLYLALAIATHFYKQDKGLPVAIC